MLKSCANSINNQPQIVQKHQTFKIREKKVVFAIDKYKRKLYNIITARETKRVKTQRRKPKRGITMKTTNTLGETKSKEWKATLMNAYGGTYDEWVDGTRARFCETYDVVMNRVRSLVGMDDNDTIFTIIELLKVHCWKLNGL